MFTFKQFIKENLHFITEAARKTVTAGNMADSQGKLAEGLVAQHLNGGPGKHPEDYRLEGTNPEVVHRVHGTYMYGQDFEKHPEYKKVSAGIKTAVQDLKTHLKKHGISKISRVAATSQGSEHRAETGVEDPHFKGDIVVTGAYSGNDHRKGKKVAVSIKYYTGKNKPTNWSNHGMQTLQGYSGADFSQHREEHEKTLTQYKIPKSVKERKEWYKKLPTKNKNRIDGSYRKLTTGAAGNYAAGLKNQHHSNHQSTQDENLKSFVKKSVGAAGHIEGGNVLEGKTHLPHVMLKLKSKSNGEMTHKVTNIPEHVHNYLSHFNNLKVDHKEGQSSVSISGVHKTTGKKMTVHRTSIYGGGTGSSLTSRFRTATTLPSEDHPSINTDKEHP
jgi:hypothetical protein